MAPCSCRSGSWTYWAPITILVTNFARKLLFLNVLLSPAGSHIRIATWANNYRQSVYRVTASVAIGPNLLHAHRSAHLPHIHKSSLHKNNRMTRKIRIRMGFIYCSHNSKRLSGHLLNRDESLGISFLLWSQDYEHIEDHETWVESWLVFFS